MAFQTCWGIELTKKGTVITLTCIQLNFPGYGNAYHAGFMRERDPHLKQSLKIVFAKGVISDESEMLQDESQVPQGVNTQ